MYLPQRGCKRRLWNLPVHRSDAVMALALLEDVPGGNVPGAAVVTHPPVPGGTLTGHGGTALRRGGRYYWALKSTGQAAAASVVQTHRELATRDVVLRPVSVTYLGLLQLLGSGHLYCADAEQWRLFAPLRSPGSRSAAGDAHYEVHAALQLV
eukprot:s1725_g25.t1